MKPKGFVGSSIESLEIARAIQAELDRDSEAVIWDQGIFEPSESTLQSLLGFVNYYHFAIFVLSPDDLAKIRNQSHLVARDNVIFELGLFFGRLGKERTFMVVPRDEPKLHLPTDLLGLTLLDFDSSKSNLRAALGPACTSIRSVIRNLQPPPGPTTFHILASPADLTQYGVAEVLGDIRIVKSSIPANVPQQTMAGALTILYSGVQISNCFPGHEPIDCASGTIADSAGITVLFDKDYLRAKNSENITASVLNTAVGGELTIEIPEGIVLREDGTSITISGIRADCTAKGIGSTVLAQVSARPIKAGSFLGTNPVTVAQVNQSMRLQVTEVTMFIGEEPQNPTIRLIEGFPEAFVQYLDPVRDGRNCLGGNSNTGIRIQLSVPPEGVELSWPDLVECGQGTGSLVLVGATRSVVMYEFRTTNQGKSDSSIEIFDVIPRISLANSASPGDLYVQVQMWPDATSLLVPRYAHPLVNDPPDLFVRVRKERGRS